MKKIKEILIKHHEVILNVTDGTPFLLLFLSGYGRYRSVTFMFMYSFLCALNKYLKKANPYNVISEYWPFIKKALFISFFFLLILDTGKGQIYPIYEDVPLWKTLLGIGIAFIGAYALRISGIRYIQSIGGQRIFADCPSCGYANVNLETECKNCSYKEGQLLDDVIINKAISEELRSEILQYKKKGLVKKLPRIVQIALKLSEDEHVLIAMKGGNIFKFVGVRKNDIRLGTKWLLMTNKRIILYIGPLGSEGWTELEIFKYEETGKVAIVREKVNIAKKPLLLIQTGEDSYKFLFGEPFWSTFKELYKDVFFKDFVRDYISRNILSCIRKRNPNL